MSESSPFIRTRNLVAGGAMLAGTAAGVGLVASDVVDIGERLSITAETAQPSDDLALAFDALIDVGVVAGGIALAKRGAHRIRIASDDALMAQHELAHRGEKKGIRRVVPAALLVTGAGIVMGNFIDINEEVSSAQVDVAGAFTSILSEKTDEEQVSRFFISSSPVPELTNDANLNFSASEAVAVVDEETKYVPGRWEWHAAYSPDNSNAQFQVLSVSLPKEVTQMPEASADCTDITVDVAKELGLQPGETLIMDGVPLTVRETLDIKSGMNLLPVLFNNEDFARCVQGDPEQGYSFMLSQGDQTAIDAGLKAAGFNDGDIANRAYVVPVDEFINNTEQTGKNNSSPLVLQAMAVSGLFMGAALSGRSRNRLVENRRVNALWHANGFSKSMLARRYAEVAESEALASSALAAPLILIVDAYTNAGIPGAEIGPSAKTILCVTGINWGVNKISTAVAVRREASKINAGKGHIL
jgi:hypothetical protein